MRDQKISERVSNIYLSSITEVLFEAGVKKEDIETLLCNLTEKIENLTKGYIGLDTYIETVELGEKSFYLLKCENKIDDGNGKMHYSLDAYMVVSMDGRIANLVDYVNGKVVYVY